MGGIVSGKFVKVVLAMEVPPDVPAEMVSTWALSGVNIGMIHMGQMRSAAAELMAANDPMLKGPPGPKLSL